VQTVPVEKLLRRKAGVPEAGFVPDLTSYDWIVVSSSAGKDSQAMLDYVTELARAAGVESRIVVVHADLGEVEWEGTGELAARQAAHYGHRFEVVSRLGNKAMKDGKVYKKGEVFGSILDYAERRGAWPSNQQRWCTSDFKRGPIEKLFTVLVGEAAARRGVDANAARQCRILDCMGLRSEESPARAKREQFCLREENSRKRIDTWLPIQLWSTEQVWTRIQASGVEHHRAYDLGMGRLSCAFCIFAPKASLVLAGKHNRALLDRYVGVEERTGHTFRMDVSLAEVRDAVDAGAEVDATADEWNM
jgi:3'-phosphoadenosine 5'-phosphosulfate sulfotransferase (PAPS reductase)/FAD synthetase